jgi:hypothetical protein
MSKKNLVKQLIDNLIEEGNDFSDLTQGSLIEMDELRDVSKTTIKRAKQEYKKEKILANRDYREQAIKRRVYKYLDRHPKSTLNELREALPSVPPAKVSEYHLFWKKKQEHTRKTEHKKKTVVSPRKRKEMIFKYLNENTEASLHQLYRAFPDAKQSSINSYYNQWRKKRKSSVKGIEGGLYQIVIKYLDNHPDADIEALKETFSDIPKRSLEVYFNIWQKKQAELQAENATIQQVVQEFIQPSSAIIEQSPAIIEPPVGKSGKRRGRPPKQRVEKNGTTTEGQPTPTSSLKSHQPENPSSRTIPSPDRQLIELLKDTIQTQKLTIDELDAEYQQLKAHQSERFGELEGIDDKSIVEIRGFLSTYLNGLKRQKQRYPMPVGK